MLRVIVLGRIVKYTYLTMISNMKINHLVCTKFFQKTNISYLLIRTRTCAYQGVKNVSFLEKFSYVLNE